MPNPNFYDSPINKALESKLEKMLMDHEIIKEKMDGAEAASILALYLKKALEYGLRHYSKPEELYKQLEISNTLISEIMRMTEDDSLEAWQIMKPELLRATALKPVDRQLLRDKIPQTSLSKSSLFTGNQHEPQVYRELKREIASADRVDLLVSFIKHSGLRLIYDDLVEHTRTKPLRVITTSYMGATDAKAVEMLAALPNTEVRISYDTKRTRLHAKAYYFERETGFSTAYIGSSNLSKAALSEGTEWNMKVSEYTSPEILAKFKITFETYWHMSEFEVFDANSSDDKERLYQALMSERRSDDEQQYFFDLKPFTYQQDILEQLEIERKVHGSYRNLVVAATGTGKTMVAAFDFLRLYKENPGIKLLFLAHREEILKQSCRTYRAVLKESNFGEYWVGGETPRDYKHVFASIQTLNAGSKYLELPKDHFDVIVLDETHHSAADSYKRIIDYFTPAVLLGLTATPERMDGRSILSDFNGRIAYEIRLHQAIEQNLLCPFHYFGITDETNLTDVKWVSGHYVTRDLSVTYIGDHARDRGILNAVGKYLSDISLVKGLGFCVDQEHAKHMADVFNKAGIPSESLDANSHDHQRRTIQSRLKSGEIKFIFVVDLYNEGVDIPYINAVLFLRPTESATIFVQQLGRGLRLHENKDVLTVLDFIGQAHQKYDYRMKFQKLVGQTRHSVKTEVELSFPSVPRNCFIQLERLAQEYVLRNLKQGQTDLRRLRQLVVAFKTDANMPLTLRNFLKYYDMTAQELYRTKCLFELNDESINWVEQCGLLSKINLSGVFYRLSQLNDVGLLKFAIEYLADLTEQHKQPYEKLTQVEQRQLLMQYYSIFENEPSIPIHEYFERIKSEATEVYEELQEVLIDCLDRVNHLPTPLEILGVPLELHATYNTTQVLSAFGINTVEKLMPFREGVKYISEVSTDIFFITLNKSEKHFSETTLYEDYAIDQWLFHWQTQSRLTTTSPTGQRYINQRTNGSRVVLFVREERSDEHGKTAAYTCLGLADYVSHQGSMPISIVYRLRHKMPVRVLRVSNKFVDLG